jgi:hypothetical protein
VCDRLTLCTLSSGAEKQGERNRGKHTPSMTFGLKRLALVGDTHLSGRLGWSRWNWEDDCVCVSFFWKSGCSNRWTLHLPWREYRVEFVYLRKSSGNRIGVEVAPLLPKHRGTPLVDLFRGASFVGEISPLEDLALLLGKQGLTHFSAHWIRCKGRPAYITVNEPLTLSPSCHSGLLC